MGSSIRAVSDATPPTGTVKMRMDQQVLLAEEEPGPEWPDVQFEQQDSLEYLLRNFEEDNYKEDRVEDDDEDEERESSPDIEEESIEEDSEDSLEHENDLLDCPEPD